MILPVKTMPLPLVSIWSIRRQAFCNDVKNDFNRFNDSSDNRHQTRTEMFEERDDQFVILPVAGTCFDDIIMIIHFFVLRPVCTDSGMFVLFIGPLCSLLFIWHFIVYAHFCAFGFLLRYSGFVSGIQ